jgi:hypothetical protein
MAEEKYFVGPEGRQLVLFSRITQNLQLIKDVIRRADSQYGI